MISNKKDFKNVNEAIEAYLKRVNDLKNESNLTLNTSVRVTCVDKISTGTFTKNLTCKELITEMIRRKIGNTKFINDARAKSFIALVRDLDAGTYGSNITLNHKNMIITYVIKGQGLDINA